MHPQQVKQLIEQVIISAISQEAMLRLYTAVAAAFEQADVTARKVLPESPSLALSTRAQLRHYLQNDAFFTAAGDSGLHAVLQPAASGAEHFPLVIQPRVLLGRVGVMVGRGMSKSKFRAELAAFNEVLEGQTGDLFSGWAQPTELERLGVLLVTVNPPTHVASQSTPLGIYLGVPFSNLRGWHYYEPLENVLALYHQEVQQAVPDLAFVKLKRQLRSNE